jgi:hypothetical protein
VLNFLGLLQVKQNTLTPGDSYLSFSFPTSQLRLLGAEVWGCGKMEESASVWLCVGVGYFLIISSPIALE